MASRRSRPIGSAAEKLIDHRLGDLRADAPAARPAVPHYRLLFERAPLPYVVTDFAGHIQAANRAAAIMLKRPAELLIGRRLGSFVPLERGAEFRETLAELPLLDRVRDWRMTLLPHDGAPVEVAMHASVLDAAWDGRDVIFWIVRPAKRRKAD